MNNLSSSPKSQENNETKLQVYLNLLIKFIERKIKNGETLIISDEEFSKYFNFYLKASEPLSNEDSYKLMESQAEQSSNQFQIFILNILKRANNTKKS